MGLNILSFNLHSLNSQFKWSLLWPDALKSKAGILCLQETHLTLPDVSHLKNKKFPHIFHFYSPGKKARMAILIKESVSFKRLDNIHDPIKGRL